MSNENTQFPMEIAPYHSKKTVLCPSSSFLGKKAFPRSKRNAESPEAKRAFVTDWITKSCRFDRDGAGCDDIQEDRYSLRDEGRNPDGTGESYAERNA